MNTSNSLARVLLISLLLLSCTENPQEIDKIDIKKEREVYKAGRVVYEETCKLIGPSGGVLQSTDKSFTIEIPSGSLSSSYDIKLQRIENTNPYGMGDGYRISPYNLKLQYPVKLTFNYTNLNLGSFPEALLITRHDKEGEWKAIGGTELRPLVNSISVETLYLGDWALCEAIDFPKTSILLPGEKVDLTVQQFISLNSEKPFPVSIPKGQEVALSASEGSFVESWNVEGEGLIEADFGKSYYIAPNDIPKNNPVAINAKIFCLDLYLTSEVMVVQEGVTFRIDEEEWLHDSLPVFNSFSGIHQLSSTFGYQSQQSNTFSFFWKEDSGMMLWDRELPQFKLIRNQLQYFHFFMKDDNKQVSPGYLQVLSTSQSKKYISGKFLLEKSGIYDTGILKGSPYTGTAKVEGFFMVRKE